MKKFLGCFLFTHVTVTAISIINKDIIDQGFCHNEHVKLELPVECGSNFTASVLHSTDGNLILQCQHPLHGSLNCGAENVTGKYNVSTDIFEIDFRYNETVHGGQQYNISISCNDSSQAIQILLKPCLSGFAVNATLFNESSIIVDCQHSSFNYSKTPLSIQQKEGNEYGTGSKNDNTPGCLILRNGLQCVVPYIPGNVYQCYLGGAVYNIDSISNQTATTHLTRNTTYATGTAAKSIGIGNTQSMLFAMLPVAAAILIASCSR